MNLLENTANCILTWWRNNLTVDDALFCQDVLQANIPHDLIAKNSIKLNEYCTVCRMECDGGDAFNWFLDVNIGWVGQLREKWSLSMSIWLLGFVSVFVIRPGSSTSGAEDAAAAAADADEWVSWGTNDSSTGMSEAKLISDFDDFGWIFFYSCIAVGLQWFTIVYERIKQLQ